MTRTFTAAEMEEEATRWNDVCQCVPRCPEWCRECRTAAMLRQAADERQESDRLHAAICQAVVLMNNGTPPFGVEAHRILREAIAATPTEPTPPPAVDWEAPDVAESVATLPQKGVPHWSQLAEPAVGRCKTCQHFDPGPHQSDCAAEGGSFWNLPKDGSGFCHLHEVAK